MKPIFRDILWLMVASVLVSWYPVLALWCKWPYAKCEVVVAAACLSSTIGFIKWADSIMNFITDFNGFVSETIKLIKEHKK